MTLGPERRAGPARAGLLCGLLALSVCIGSAASGADMQIDDDSRLRDAVEARLVEVLGPTAGSIRTSVRDGQVVLQGRVRLLDDSLRAERAVWKIAGVIDLENEIRVVPLESWMDSALEREIRLLLKADGRFLDTQLEVSVDRGRVAIRGRFEDASDVLDLKHRIAELPGVLHVDIDALLFARLLPETARP